jgi:hypothetical protein
MRILQLRPIRRSQPRETARRRSSSWCSSRTTGTWLSWLASLTILAGVLFGSVLVQSAGAESLRSPLSESAIAAPTSPAGLGYSLTRSSTEPYAVCPPTPGRVTCLSIADPPAIKTASGYKVSGVGPLLEGGGEKGGLDPKDLQSAYKIPTTGGATQTVAIVDAYGYKEAEADLAKYREKYGLSECKKENAKKEVTNCFRKVNEEGKETFTLKEGGEEEKGWTVETALDMDMVSAACPECHILLVEATEPTTHDLAISVDEAATLKATEISNSYGTPENDTENCPTEGCKEYLGAYTHPGIPITASAGDRGFDNGVGAPDWPASAPTVIAVGGTTLKKAENSRGWSETVWGKDGSGCSLYEAKPTWQTDWGCGKRMTDDVAAVANNIESPVSIYNTPEYGGWYLLGGTSVAAPLVAGIEAHASETVKKEEGAEAFYKSGLFDVTSGRNGYCKETYLCNAEEGYDGPTGWGTPDGPLELAAGYHAVTEEATNATATEATLNGYINPEGVETTYHFEYGPTTAYGTNLPAKNASVGSGKLWKAVSQRVTGGLWGTYHYRLAATRGSETIYGADHTATTTPWVVQETPDEGSNENILEDVSCASSVSCAAVGSREGSGTRWPIAEGWNGHEWKLQTVARPSGATYAELWGVACSSASACITVGNYTNSSKVEVPLVETWNGTAWSTQTVPVPEGAKASYLGGVSCSSSTECTALGKYTNSSGATTPLAERWNGTEWSLQTVATPEGSKEVSLLSPSCSSSSSCTAVGHYTNSSKVVVPLAEIWNGTAWTVESVPSPTEGKAVELSDVSCLSASTCTAVGHYYNNSSGSEAALAEVWNGTSWSVQAVPNPTGAKAAHLYGVACSSSSACIAVGGDDVVNGNGENINATLSEALTGSEWAVLGTPIPEELGVNEYAGFVGVSCTASTNCEAVGERNECGEASCTSGTLAEQYSTPGPTAETEAATSVTTSGAILQGVVNPETQETTYNFEYGKTTTYGTNVPVPSGNAGYGTSPVKESYILTSLEPTTTYHFRIVATSPLGNIYGKDHEFTTKTPSWQITTSQNPAELYDYFDGASCISATSCTAVGEDISKSSSEPSTLAEAWNGTEWKTQSTPNVSGAKGSSFEKVSCASTSSCMAVGYYRNTAGTYFALGANWNGTEWKINTTPEPAGSLNSLLEGISCSSASACTAVGYYENSSGVIVPFGERWNGTEWTLQTILAPTGGTEVKPFSVSCASTTACVLAGSYVNSSKVEVPLAESWNGTEWTIQLVPAPTGSTRTEGWGVSCTSSSACTMVGKYEDSSGIGVTLAERWNGTTWSVQTTPNPTEDTETILFGVSCTSSTACTAVGTAVDTKKEKPPYSAPLAEHWNGIEWKTQSIPDPEAGAALAGGISCSSLVSCAAVGTSNNKTLAEIYR